MKPAVAKPYPHWGVDFSTWKNGLLGLRISSAQLMSISIQENNSLSNKTCCG